MCGLAVFNYSKKNSIMPIDYLLKLAHDYYARARVTADPVAKRTLVEIGDIHLNEAEKQKRTRALNTPAVEATIEPKEI